MFLVPFFREGVLGAALDGRLSLGSVCQAGSFARGRGRTAVEIHRFQVGFDTSL